MKTHLKKLNHCRIHHLKGMIKIYLSSEQIAYDVNLFENFTNKLRTYGTLEAYQILQS